MYLPKSQQILTDLLVLLHGFVEYVQRSSGVALAGVTAAIRLASTHHVVRDSSAIRPISALFIGYYWHLHLEKDRGDWFGCSIIM